MLFLTLRGDDGDGGGKTGSGPVATTTQPTGTETAEKPSKPEAPPVPTIVVRGGEPVGGVRELEFSKGDRVRFRVRSDVADEVHVHGYDISKDVQAGGTVSFSFPAEVEGIYEAELERGHVHLLELVINP